MKSKPSLLIAIGGLSGTGKSTLSDTLSQNFTDMAENTFSINSDTERKSLWAKENNQACDLYEKLPVEAYSSAFRAKAYAQLFESVASAMQSHDVVIIDATFTSEDQRSAIAALAHEKNDLFIGLWLNAPTETMIDRADKRAQSAEKSVSDADGKIVELQLKSDLGTITWPQIDAGQSQQSVQFHAIQAISQALAL
jgi:predicted kinase